MTKSILNAPTPNATKLELLRQHFPGAIETDENGHVRLNTAALQLALDPSNPAGIQVEEDGYELRWVGKREAYHSAFVPVQKILSPLPDESKNWDTTSNLLIKGDNLDALRLLRQSYFGKVKLIYIDPPYNTQSDAFIYRDNFSARQSEVLAQLGYSADNIDYIKNIYGARTHSGWLSFMYPRLLLAKDLLRDDGVIFISIDDNEQAQLKLLCDEVFGQENFVSNLIWKSKSGGANDSEHFANDHEYIIGYAKQRSAFKLQLDMEATVTTSYNRQDEDGEYALDRLDKQSIRYSTSGDFEITGPDGRTYRPAHKDPSRPNATWRWSPKKVSAQFGELVFENGCIYTKNYKSDGAIPRTLLTEDRFGRTRTGKTDLFNLMNQEVFSSPKPHKLVSYIASIATTDNDLILDFFAGSGTTAEAVMRLNAEDGGNRQFMLVQIPQQIDKEKHKDIYQFVTQTLQRPNATIFEITAERIRRAGSKLEAELAIKASKIPALPTRTDTGFRVFDLVNDPEALILQKPLQQASQADVQTLQAAIATPQPAQLPRILYNLLLAENLPLTTVLRTVIDQQLYLAANVAFVVRALPLNLLTDTLRALQQEAKPPAYLTVYAPWIADDNFMLGIKTMAETLGYSEDKLQLRG